MCPTCGLIRANVQVCGVVVSRGACGELHAVAGAPEEVLEMLTSFIQSKENIPFPTKPSHSPIGSSDEVPDHSWTLEYVRKRTWKLCFHAKTSSG